MAQRTNSIQWRVTLPSAIYFILGIMIYNKVRKVPFQLSLIKKDTTKQRCCVRGGEDSTPLPNHKSSILQDQASPKLIEWVNNYIVSHSTHMMHSTKRNPQSPQSAVERGVVL